MIFKNNKTPKNKENNRVKNTSLNEKTKVNWKYLLIIFLIAIVVGAGLLWLFKNQEYSLVDLPIINKKQEPVINTNKEYGENSQFRNLIVKFTREAADNYIKGESVAYPSELEIEGNWNPSVTIYYNGEIRGEGNGKNEKLSVALEQATQNALNNEKYQSLKEGEIKDARFLISFPYLSNQLFSFIEYQEEGKETIEDLVIIRDLDKELIGEKIEEGKNYLFRMIDKDEGGVHKYYYALDDTFEDRLHTIYTASSIFTLLKLYDFFQDEEIFKQALNSSEFILFMQDNNKESRSYGAFHYSFFLENKERETQFVVGTASKTIFTLLELYKRTNDDKYLNSAKLAADWLLTMQDANGEMKSYIKYSDGKWFSSAKQSYLYNGQVLSALSRIYKITEEKKYYDAAEKIAKNFTKAIEKEGCYLGDDYRSKNVISSSWAVLALFDFYKAGQDSYYKNIVFKCSEDLLGRQINNKNDILNYGRWQGSYTTSGTGWLSEVLVEVYKLCKEEDGQGCEKYKDAITEAIRWLIQNTYTKDSSFMLENPEMALGGLFWNQDYRYVRTDSVCHGLNAYVSIVNELEDGVLVSIPEKPFEEILDELKK